MDRYQPKRIIYQILITLFIFCTFISISGCEAFVKKFTRKPKKDKIESPVLVPEDYSPLDIPVEQRYRQYFLYWQSWQEELISALGSAASHKKRKTCIEEAIKNLLEMRHLLFEEKQKELEIYIEKSRLLENDIVKDIYGTKTAIHKIRAESLKRNIFKEFSFPKIKNHLR